MKVENQIFYQVARNRNFKVGDKLHFGDEPNGQTKIFDFSFQTADGQPLHKMSFSQSKKLIKSQSAVNEMAVALVNYDLFMREIALEHVRREKFPQLPSRFACMFLSDDCEVAKKNYLSILERQPIHSDEFTTLQLVKVCVTGEAFFAKDVQIGREGLSFNEYAARAVEFWGQKQDPNDKPHNEILFVGDAEIVEILEQFTKISR